MSSQIERLKGIAGVYALLIELKESREIRIGRAGPFTFRKGFYVYVGSALGETATSLGWRLLRYRTSPSKKKWHIDFFLADSCARISAIKFAETTERSECRLSHAISSRRWAKVPMTGFGASDCREECPAHLYRANLATLRDLRREVDNAFRESDLSPKELLHDFEDKAKSASR